MAAQVASNGETITLTGSEIEVYPREFAGQQNIEIIVNLEIVTGTNIQFAVGESVAGKHRTYANVGDKAIRTVMCNSSKSLRANGTGSFTIGW